MSECLLLTGLAVGLFLLKIGGMWAARQHRIRESRRPRADRIASIRRDAAFMIRSLQEVLDRPYAREHPESTAWISAVLDLYRRLEALAASSDPAPEECRKLAEEASAYVRQHRLKAVGIDMLAEGLAAIVADGEAATRDGE